MGLKQAAQSYCLIPRFPALVGVLPRLTRDMSAFQGHQARRSRSGAESPLPRYCDFCWVRGLCWRGRPGRLQARTEAKLLLSA